MTEVILNERDNLYYDHSVNPYPADEMTYIWGDDPARDWFVGGDDTIYGLRDSDEMYGEAYEAFGRHGGDDQLFGGVGNDDIAGDFGNMGAGQVGGEVIVEERGMNTVITVDGGGTVTLVKYTDGLTPGDDLLFA